MRVRSPPSEQWEFYDRQSSVAKQRALDRVLILDVIELLIESGMTKSNAVVEIAATKAISAASIWNWMIAVTGVHRGDRLAYLVPKFRGGGRRADIDPVIFQPISADYLRRDRPSWAECIRSLGPWAEAAFDFAPARATPGDCDGGAGVDG